MQLGRVSAAALRHRAESAGEGEGVAIAHRRAAARKWLPHDAGGEGRVGLVVHWRRKEAADGGGERVRAARVGAEEQQPTVWPSRGWEAAAAGGDEARSSARRF